VHDGGKWPDKAAECVFRDDHALRMCQREGVNWLVFNWRACFGWAFSFAPCRLHATRTATLWQTAYCICTRAVSPPPSQRPRSRSPLSIGLWGQTTGASGSFCDGLAGTSAAVRFWPRKWGREDRGGGGYPIPAAIPPPPTHPHCLAISEMDSGWNIAMVSAPGWISIASTMLATSVVITGLGCSRCPVTRDVQKQISQRVCRCDRGPAC
jgi:hypothetical protein